MGIRRNQTGNVQSPTRRPNFPTTSQKTTQKAGLQTKLNTPGFWTHEWRPISFSICVDNFGVEYVGKKHDDHLIAVLQEHYKISNDWDGKRYLVLDLDWDYKKPQSSHVHAHIRHRRSQMLHPHPIAQTPAPTLPTHQTNLWCNSSVHQRH